MKKIPSFWLWILGAVIVFIAITFVTYEQHHAREKYEAKRQAECVALSLTFEQKYSCYKEAQSRKDYTPWWYVLVTWPEGITVWAIIGTGFVIAWQSYATSKAAKATEDAVTASRASLAIQEAEFFQWVDIGEWKVEKDPDIHWVRVNNKIQYTGPLKVRISFPLLNNTARPLSIHSVQILLETGIEKTVQAFVVGENMQVPPKGEYSVVIDTVFTESHVMHYIEYSLFILASVQVRFSNALGKPDGTTFTRLVACRADEGTRSVSRGHKAEEIESQKPN